MVPPINPWKLTGYKAGQNVACKVMGAEPGGYAVVISKDNLPGFLPTDAKLKIGEEVLAQFVCVHNNRVLLSARFAGGTSEMGKGGYGSNLSVTQQIDWQAELKGTSEPDKAFDVWAGSNTARYHLKRATDLILPPLAGQQPTLLNMAQYDREWLITDLEGGMRTACLKATNEKQLSRGAVILYKGRAVGCIYSHKTMPDSLPTEQSLSFLLKDLALPETQLTIYDLPEDVTLAMSALFLGYPVQRSDDLDARTYMDYICNWIQEKGQTACLVLTLPGASANCLVFMANGQYVGCFYVEDQKFNPDKNYVYQLLANEPQAGLEASILPPEITSPSVRFGYSLSMALKRQ